MQCRTRVSRRAKTIFTFGLVSSIGVFLVGCLSGNTQSPDPTVANLVVAYVKRPVPVNNNGEVIQNDARELLSFTPGGDLFIKSQASPSAPETNVTNRVTNGLGDVRDVEVSYDGEKLIFSLHLPLIENADEEDQPKWGMWEYDIGTDQLSRIISSDNIANSGHDVAPHYLPDGRIVFSSTRQRGTGAILLDEGKPQYAGLDEDQNEAALLLHVINADRDDITQVSFNQSHDLDPVVLQDGKILFSRWDNAGARSQMSFYKVNPDGTNLEIVYGAHSHNTGTNGSTIQFVQPRELPNGNIMAITRPFTGTIGGGDIALFNTADYVDATRPTFENVGLLSGPGHSNATETNVRTDGAVSPGGRFAAAFPLWDGTDRMLVSWSQCRLVLNNEIVPCTTQAMANPDAVEASPIYGIFLYDRSNHTQRPVVAPQEGIEIKEVVAAQKRSLPEIIFDKTSSSGLSQAYLDEGVGVIQIQSVYDFDGTFNSLDQNPSDGINITSLATMADVGQTTADQRPARFLRIVKAVPIPEDVPNSAFGPAGELMREIIGYTMVEPDGSVMVKVPANIPIALEVLDKNARRITARHSNWIQVKAGETVTCNGCHNHAGGLPHGRNDGTPALNAGAPTSGLPFTNASTSLIPEIGENMAQTRARVNCTPACGAAEPTVNVVFEDVWTNNSVRAIDPPFNYLYADISTFTPQTSPVSAACVTNWNNLCRTIIHYETHIHPLWSKTRQTLDINNNVTLDQTCTLCHNTRDANNALQVPAGQLDLSNGASADEADQFLAYRELLFTDNEQEIVNGALQDRLIQNGFDVDGNPIFTTIPVSPSMSGSGAISSDFFDVFTVPTDTTHFNALNSAELRLLSEWLDIGAQYYNNPFAVPAN